MPTLILNLLPTVLLTLTASTRFYLLNQKIFIIHYSSFRLLCSLSLLLHFYAYESNLQWHISSHSKAIYLIYIQLNRLVILSKPISPEANNISVRTPDIPGALPFFILVFKVDLTLYLFVVEVQLLDLLRLNFPYYQGTLH